MFKSIRWKFITIYFLLVFIAMVIVGVFIIKMFEEHQLKQVTDTMKKHVITIVRTSTVIGEDDWTSVKDEIQSTISQQWNLGHAERLYVIDNSDVPQIIATNSSNYVNILGQSALASRFLEPSLILKALKGQEQELILPDDKDNMIKHLAYPVVDQIGNIKGIMYITADLNDMYSTIEESKTILTKATLLALFITVLLGFLIASSITEPIKDVTVKAEEMARGNFDQFVSVKSDDEIGQLASMFNNLTLKLKSTLAEVHKEKSKLDTIFNYMADGVLAVSIEGYIIHANPIALEMLKIKYEDIYDIKYDEVFEKLNSKITLKHIETKEKWEGNETIEIDSSIYNAKYAPFKNEKDEIGGLIIVFQDITDQHKLENMRKEFVANVSHELKTPITTIKSYTETLLEGAVEDRELSQQFLTVMDRECDRMTRIVRDLLQLSNLDYKQTKWNKTSLSINEILEDACMKMQMAAKEKNQRLLISYEGHIPKIVADKDGIEQVILNIISNAIKYTPENGNISIKGKTEDNKVRVTVTDDGIGIPEEDQARIFERFYRVDKARSRDQGGTGLGLSIAKQIIESHNGQIILKSEYNTGTAVDIILPIE